MSRLIRQRIIQELYHMLNAAHHLYLIELQVATNVAVWTVGDRGKLIIPPRLVDLELQESRPPGISWDLSQLGLQIPSNNSVPLDFNPGVSTWLLGLVRRYVPEWWQDRSTLDLPNLIRFGI